MPKSILLTAKNWRRNRRINDLRKRRLISLGNLGPIIGKKGPDHLLLTIIEIANWRKIVNCLLRKQMDARKRLETLIIKLMINFQGN
jgi:hypothetical protein